MWMGYSETDTALPRTSAGGGAPTGGTRYYFDEDSDVRRPSSRAFYDGQWFIGEWNNDWIKTADLNNQGLATGVAAAARSARATSARWTSSSARRLAVRRRVGPGLRGEQPGLGRLPRRLHPGRALSRSRNATVEQRRRAGRHDGQVLVRRLQRSGRHGRSPTCGTSATARRRPPPPNPSHTVHGGRHLRRDADRHRRVRRHGGGHRPRGRRQPAAGRHDRDPGERQGRRLRRQGPVQGLRSSIPTAAHRQRDQLRQTSASSSSSATTRTRTSCPRATGCEGEFTVTGVDGHGIDANIFTVITASYTDAGNGPAGAGHRHRRGDPAAQAQAGRVLVDHGPHRRRPRHRRPGRRSTRRRPTSAAATRPRSSRTATGSRSTRTTSRTSTRSRSAWPRPARAASIQLRYDAADGPLVAETPNIAPTGGWQTWQRRHDRPAGPPIPQGTHRLFVVFRHPTATGSLMNLNWFKFTGKGAAVTAPPEVNADRRADQRRGAAQRRVRRGGDGRRGRGHDLRLGLRRPRHDHRHLDRRRTRTTPTRRRATTRRP